MNGHTRGFEDSLVLSYEDHPIDHIEPVPEIDDEEVRRFQQYDPELIGTLLRVLLFPDFRKCQLRPAWHRLIALAHVLHVPGIGDRPLSELAEELGVSRALLSHYATILRDFGGLDHRAGKSPEARKIWSETARQVWHGRKRARHTATG